MNNGINFSLDGPMIDGTWQNMQTGDIFEVRDSFFQDGQLMIQATDGRMFDYNTIQNYVKVDKPIHVEKPKKKPKQNESPKETLPKEIVSELENINDSGVLLDELELINGIANKIQNVPSIQAQNVPEDEDLKLITRVLTRVKTEPLVDYKVTWKNFPIKQMEMLVDYMGVPVEKICNYYIDKLTIEDIKKSISEMLYNFISTQLDQPTEDKPSKPKK